MEGYSLFDYWFILYRRRKTVYLIIFFSLVFSAGLSLVLPEVYEAESVFFVPAKTNSLTFSSVSSDPKQITRAPLVPEAKGEQLKIYLGILDSEILRQKVHAVFPQKSIRRLKKDVDFHGGSNFMLKVYVRDADPKMGADIANTYVRLFNETLNGYSLKVTDENRTAMERQLIETRPKLTAARNALVAFQQKNKINTVDEESQNLTRMKTDLEKSMEEANIKSQEVNRKIESLQQEFSKELGVYQSSSAPPTSPLTETIERQLSDLESQIAGARIKYTENHPEVANLRAQYERKKEDLSKEIDRLMKSEIKSPNTFLENLRQDLVHLYIERETTHARGVGLRQGIANVERQMAAVPGMSAQYQELRQQVDQYDKLIQSLESGVEELAAQQKRDLENVVVVDAATPAESAIFPNLILNLLVALGMGLVGGIFYAYFIDYLDRLKLNLEEDIHELEKEYV